MIPPLRGLFAVGIALAVAGVAASIARIEEYLATPFALDSTSGVMAFYTESLFSAPDTDAIAQYLPFSFGIEPIVAIAGLAIVIVSIALAAGLRNSGRSAP